MTEPTLEERIGRLEAAVARLQAERDIVATLFTYSNAIDRRASREWADCFVADGILKIIDRDGQERCRFTGHKEIMAFGENHSDAFAFRHGIAHPRITVDGDRAHVSSGYTLIAGFLPEPTLSAWGSYEDDLVRQPDGLWRFEQRTILSFQAHPELVLFKS